MERFSDKNFSYSSRSFGISKMDKISKISREDCGISNCDLFRKA